MLSERRLPREAAACRSRGLARDMFIGRRNRHPGGTWVERSRRVQLLRRAIQMRDSGALSEDEFASLSSLLLEGRPVPEASGQAAESHERRR
jgi:hypothetical protein